VGNRTGYGVLELVEGNWAPTASYELIPSLLNQEYTDQYSTMVNGVATPTHRIVHWYTSPTFADPDGFFLATTDSAFYYQVYRDSQWTDSLKTIYGMNFNNQIPLTATVSQWTGSAWVALSFTTYTYNNTGELLEEVTKAISSEGDSTNLERIVYARAPITEIAPKPSLHNPIQFKQTNQGITMSLLSNFAGDANITIHSAKGNLVFKSNSTNKQQRNLQWNYLGNNNQKVESGIYYINATMGSYTKQQTFFVQ